MKELQQSVKQERADRLCGVTGAYAPSLALLRAYKHISKRNVILKPNGTNIDNCPDGRLLCATINWSGGRFLGGGGYYNLVESGER